MTRLCVPITATTPRAMIDDALRAVEAGTDILELRLDYLDCTSEFDDTLAAIAAIRHQEVPIILTCRVSEEGGHYRGDESARRELMESLYLGISPDGYLDV